MVSPGNEVASCDLVYPGYRRGARPGLSKERGLLPTAFPLDLFRLGFTSNPAAHAGYSLAVHRHRRSEIAGQQTI